MTSEGKAVQRKLAAILNADVVGYTRLMRDDEQATIYALNKCRVLFRDSVKSHFGRIQDTAGDSVLAAFHSAIEAVKCAVELQEAVARLNADVPSEKQMLFRMGLHLGDIVDDDGTIYGDGINVAARLQSLAQPGGVNLSVDLYRQVARRLNYSFIDIGVKHLKNISEPIHVYRIETTARGPGPSDGVPRNVVDVSHPVPGFSRRPAIAVLPFDNLSHDPNQEFFSDGLTEDIIVGLSNLRYFPVISRNSTFVYKGRSVNVSDIGKALGAQYLLEGTVRMTGDRLRVTVELIDTELAHTVWGQRYDRELRDLFEVQEDIAISIVAALEPEIDKAEQLRSYTRPRENLDTWSIVRQGLWHQHKLTREHAAEARLLFGEALERDPNSIEALIALAWWHFWDAWTQRGPQSGWIDMERLARRALVLDDKDSRAHMLIGIAELMQKNIGQGRGPLQRAIKLNPSQALAHSAIGTSYILAGQPEQALRPMDKALRLSPHDLFIFHALGELAVAYYMLERFEEALEYAERSLRLRPGYAYAHVVRIGCYARMGLREEAYKAAQELRRRRPNFGVRDIEWLPYVDPKWNRYLIEGVRMAGIELPCTPKSDNVTSNIASNALEATPSGGQE